MASRLELHALLCEILGSNHCYYQPPETVKLVYPCIIYELDTFHVNHANNRPYNSKKRYSITLIDKKVDSPIIDKLQGLPLCKFDRHYTASNLNHYLFNIYY